MKPLEPYDSNNIFTKIIEGAIPCEKIYEDAATFAFMDIMPRGTGHCLVIPKVGARSILDVKKEDFTNIMETARLVSRAAMTAYDADGITLQQFSEPAGGQVVFHIHVHIIPRFDGVKLLPHTGKMEDPDILKTNAEKIRRVLAQ